MRFTISILAVFFAFVLISCSNEETKWKEAMEKNSLISYAEFIKNYPESQHVKEAYLHIETIEWDSTLIKNSIIDYNRFINKYSKSQHVKEARTNIESIEWDCAFVRPCIDTLNYYINKYPQSPNVQKAREEISAIKWPLIKINSANRLFICSKGKRESYGFPFLYLTEYGELKFEDNDRAVIIWRDFTPKEEEYAKLNGLCTGIAYLWKENGDYRFIRKVDLQKTDNELKAEFGIKK